VSSGTGYREWNVTSQVRTSYENGVDRGFLIRDAGENADAEQQFDSREAGSNPPQLVLTFGAPDFEPPETTIDSGPTGETTSMSATFGFSSSESGSTFECSLDQATFTSFTSPRQYTGLGVGSHEIRVRATDASGNTDETPAVRTWTVTPACSTVTVGADRDSWVLQSAAGNNFGADSVLKVDSNSGNSNARALVRFNLPATPAGCQVTGVKLRLYASSYNSGRTLQAFQLNGNWTETGVTWSNQAATTGTAATAPSRSSAGYMEWTVTSQVQSMYSGSNHGFLIRDATENGSGNQQSFHNTEKAPDNPPQLVVTFG
jgi:large repetitive protein